VTLKRNALRPEETEPTADAEESAPKKKGKAGGSAWAQLPLETGQLPGPGQHRGRPRSEGPGH
jgi:hypothetical protein